MICTKCGLNNAASGHKWCKLCKAAYMRLWRTGNGSYSKMEARQKFKSRSRAYANVYYQRGLLSRPDLCEACELRPPEEKHHEDYSQPLNITWLCKKCHIGLHSDPKD